MTGDEARSNEDEAYTPAEGYDRLAECAEDLGRHGNPWGDSAFQAFYAWPATRELLPGVSGSRVLVAGCGVGDHVGWFLDRGADVVGIDVSGGGVETASRRHGDRATFGRADLADSLPFEADAFDMVLSHLVLDHVEGLCHVFRELSRVLSPGGTLVFSMIHPVRRFLRHDDVSSYHESARAVTPWPGAPVPSYHRPIEAIVNPLADAGFRLDELREPEPEDAYEEHAPDRYERALERPSLLCVRAEN